MLKQILSKFPRKALKLDSPDFLRREIEFEGTHDGNIFPNRSNNTRRPSSAIFPASNIVGIEPLLPFKDVPNSEKMNLFISKLNLCSIVFDFKDPSKNSVEKDLKRQTLIELVEFVSSTCWKFPEPAIIAMCRMCAMNLFRIFSSHYRSNSGGENEDDEPVFDPAWSHLQIIYDLFVKFITSSHLEAKASKKYIDHSFIVNLLELFDSEDPRERECLKTLLHRIYGKFTIHRPFIRKAISNVFFRFVFETERHNGIAELLEIFGSVISGFALPLKEEHRVFLWRGLIPLHKPKSLGVYFQQLSYCATQFIEKDSDLASMVIRGLLKYWPVTSSQKQVMFLSEMEEIVEGISMVEFRKIMIPLFARVGYCISSYHFQVCERALYLWNNDRVASMIMQNRDVILPIIFPALEKNIESHWNQGVASLSLNVKRIFSETDERLVFECRRKLGERKANMTLESERRKETWERLEKEASLHAVIVGKTPVLVSPSIS